tara:strand:+ start:836 stop:967 length:132 start_codon:yes stop_codon:yes gene_type:complete
MFHLLLFVAIEVARLVVEVWLVDRSCSGDDALHPKSLTFCLCV